MTLQEEAQDLIKKLSDTQGWYDIGRPVIPDSEWDEWYFRLMEIEKQMGYALEGSPTQNIEYSIVNQLNKVEHSHPMLSLNKTKDIDEFHSFGDGKDFILMLKMDGLTASITYEDGLLKRAETRGNGIIGEDITHNIKVLSNVPKRISLLGTVVIDGEVISTYSNFENFSNVFANPRNMAAGSIRLLDSSECAKRGLSFIAWDCIQGLDNEYYLSDKLSLLKYYGFDVVPNLISNNDMDKQELEAMIEHLRNQNKDYPIDGMVMKLDRISEYESKGRTAHHFSGGLAFKFYDEEYDTELLDIEWSMGRTGELTPVAIFKPVNTGDSVIERASLHNISIMYDTLHIPFTKQKIKVIKSNEIIPQVSWAEKISEGGDLMCPEICPICEQPTSIHKSDSGVETLWCENPYCEGKITNQIDHFIGKKGLDIKGLSIKTLEKLIEWGWVNDIEDIFELGQYHDDWINKSGFGTTSVEKILAAIQQSTTSTTLDKYICALGIPLIGSTNAKELAKKIDTWENFREKVINKFDFSEWNTFGVEKAQAILDYDYTLADIVVDRYMRLTNPLIQNENDNSLKDKTFVITGSLNGYKNRDELKAFIESKGGKVTGSVSKNTDFLINNDATSTSSKNKKAKELGVKIITEKEFLDLI